MSRGVLEHRAVLEQVCPARDPADVMEDAVGRVVVGAQVGPARRAVRPEGERHLAERVFCPPSRRSRPACRCCFRACKDVMNVIAGGGGALREGTGPLWPSRPAPTAPAPSPEIDLQSEPDRRSGVCLGHRPSNRMPAEYVGSVDPPGLRRGCSAPRRTRPSCGGRCGSLRRRRPRSRQTADPGHRHAMSGSRRPGRRGR